MKNNKKWFIFTEAVLAAMLIVMTIIILWERNGEDASKVSVIVQNSDDGQWSAFKYGLKMAAQDKNIEMFVVSSGEILTIEDEIKLINREIAHGADAVIVQPVPGKDVQQKLKNLEKKIPLMLVGCTASEKREDSLLPVTEADHYALGKTLAEELLKDYNGNLGKKDLGIITETEDSEAAINRRRGFEDTLKGTEAEIRWTVSGAAAEDDKNSLENQRRVDLVIALDDTSLMKAGEYSAAGNLYGALVYGIANSTKAVYYLDTGIAKCLVMPDEFSAGYQSLTETAESLSNSFYTMKNQNVSYTVLRKDEIFTEKNQDMLFTMSQ